MRIEIWQIWIDEKIVGELYLKIYVEWSHRIHSRDLVYASAEEEIFCHVEKHHICLICHAERGYLVEYHAHHRDDSEIELKCSEHERLGCWIEDYSHDAESDTRGELHHSYYRRQFHAGSSSR